jgi:hypothetical protein
MASETGHEAPAAVGHDSSSLDVVQAVSSVSKSDISQPEIIPVQETSAVAPSTVVSSYTNAPDHAKNDGPTRLASAFEHSLSLGSLAVHADDYINTHRAVAPAMHVSTTFRYAENPDSLVRGGNIDVRDSGSSLQSSYD